MEANLCILTVLSLLLCTSAQLVNFTNPILDTPSHNPCVLKLNGFYYLALTEKQDTEVHILKTKYLTDFRFAQSSLIYQIPSGYSGLLTSEMIQLDGQLYLYIGMRNTTHTYNQYVLKANDADNPMGSWSAPTRLLENIWNQWSVHGGVMEHGNGQQYFLWSSKHPSVNLYSIYIAQMSSPTNVTEPVVRLREPMEEWECQGECVNEAPHFIYNGRVSYMVFSASSSLHRNCSLSYMSIESSMDPMVPSNWISIPEPVFIGSEEEGVYAACHATFTTSPDGSETWMIYQGSNIVESTAESLVARIEKIDWNKDNGAPIFTRPHGQNAPQPRPSGEPEMFLNPILDSGHPEIFRLGDYYYMPHSENEGTTIQMLQSDSLTQFYAAERTTIFSAPEGHQGIWVIRLHELDGELYMYFKMQNASSDLRMFVIKADDASNPMGTWSFATKILENVWDFFAAHGTVLQQNGEFYFVWKSITPELPNPSLYIAAMDSPTTIVEPVVLLREPRQAWECGVDGCALHIPTVVYNRGIAFVVFVAAPSSDPNCGFSYMSIEQGRNPLDVSNWNSALGQSFGRNDDEGVYYPTFASFTTSPDGKETWMAYHAYDSEDLALRNVSSRLEKVEWNEEDGAPIFPKAHGFRYRQPVPASPLYFEGMPEKYIWNADKSPQSSRAHGYNHSQPIQSQQYENKL